MPGRCQDGALDGDQGLEFADASGQAPVAGAQEGGVLGAVGCHRGNTEGAGERHKPAHTRHGDHWLTGALGVAAMAANRTQDTTFLGARYRRLARRIGKIKALVAIQRSILTATWHVLSQNTDYHDLGGDYHAKRDPQRALRRITRDANPPRLPVPFGPIQGALLTQRCFTHRYFRRSGSRWC